MEIFLWLFLISYIFKVVAHFTFIHKNEYPRVVTYSVGHDLTYFVVSIILVIWIAVLL